MLGKTKRKKSKIFLLVFLTAAVFCGLFVMRSNAAWAGVVFGWLWGGSEDQKIGGNPGVIDGNETGVGWISMNSRNCDIDGDGIMDRTNVGSGSGDMGAPAGCPPEGIAVAAYQVVIPEGDGTVNGFGWTPNLGYTDFAPAKDLAKYPACGYPTAPCSSAFRAGNELDGWARFNEIAAESKNGNSGGWEGWIKLKGSATASVKQCVDGPKSGQACNTNGDCAEEALCTTKSAVSGDVTSNSDAVDVRLIGNGNQIEIWSWGKSNYYGNLTLSGCTVSGDVTTNSDAVDFRLIGSGNLLQIWSWGKSNYYGNLTLSGCTVSGDVTTDSDAVDVRLIGNGNQIDVWSWGKSNYYGKLVFSLSMATCPLAGGSVCAGNPKKCSAAHACNLSGTTKTNYGVTIDAQGKLSGFAWSNELGWIDFKRAYMGNPPLIKYINAKPKRIIITATTPTPVNTQLSWKVENCVAAKGCVCTASGDGGWTGSKNTVQGNEVVAVPSAISTYTLRCENEFGFDEKSETVNVGRYHGVCMENETCGSEFCLTTNFNDPLCQDKCTVGNQLECINNQRRWKEIPPE